jgi:hypothetical protein
MFHDAGEQLASPGCQLRRDVTTVVRGGNTQESTFGTWESVRAEWVAVHSSEPPALRPCLMAARIPRVCGESIGSRLTTGSTSSAAPKSREPEVRVNVERLPAVASVLGVALPGRRASEGAVAR